MIPAPWRVCGLVTLALLIPACGTGGADGTLTPTVAPGIPSQLTAVAGNRRVTLTWKSTANVTSVVVFRSLTSGGPYFPVSVPGQFPTPTSYVDDNLRNGTPYFYVVSAANAYGVSPVSEEAGATPGFRPKAVAAGPRSFHTLALFEDGTVWGWGSASNGELSVLNSFGIDRPLLIPALPRMTAVAAGWFHSLGIQNDGTVWAWGRNSDGELGNGTASSDVFPPAPVLGMSNAVAISAGGYHSLALRSDGTVWGWGDNTFGQLGPPRDTTVATPIPGLSGIVAVAAGFQFSLALKDNGTVFAWGDNQSGQIGLAAGPGVPTPTQIPNLNGVEGIAAGGQHALALRGDGRVYAWGSQSAGQLGNGVTAPAYTATPAQVLNLANVTAISAGDLHSLAIRQDGTAWAWGENNNEGVLGTGATSGISNVPLQVANLDGIVALSAGAEHSVALQEDGTVWTWGRNGLGELGTGENAQGGNPSLVQNLTPAAAAAGGYSHSVALRTDGTLWAWGANAYGELGNGSTSSVTTPQPGAVLTPAGITAVASGSDHGVALHNTGAVYTWGLNEAGQIGNGSSGLVGVPTPYKVVALSGTFIGVGTGGRSSMAIRNDHTLWTWGANYSGQLGTGAAASVVPTPAKVSLTNVVAVAGGGSHTLALLGDGTLWSWGDNFYGQLGVGTLATAQVSTPVAVVGLSGVTAIAAGESFSLAVLSDGTVWGWGWNKYRQIGSVTASNMVPSPIQIPGFSGAVAVTAGLEHAAALKADGTVWTWGRNESGQLGRDSSAGTALVAPVPNLSGVLSLSAGAYHNLAVLSDGMMMAWGDNFYQQLGRPLVNFRAVPVRVQE